MKVELLSNTDLWVASKAIRTCWQSQEKSDTFFTENGEPWHYGSTSDKTTTAFDGCGEKDKELIYRVGNKFKHASTLEHLVYTFDIDGISRACLQELARHRMASLSVKSTRYTLKELKDYPVIDSHTYEKFLVSTNNDTVDIANITALEWLQKALQEGVSNDIVKYCLPEAYKTSLVWTINARSLQNFLQLRTSKSALWEIRELAKAIFKQLPEEHKYLFEECVEGENNE